MGSKQMIKAGVAVVVVSSILAGGLALSIGAWWLAAPITLIGAITAATVTSDER